MIKRWRYILIIMIAVSSLMALYLGYSRHLVEKSNKQVDLVLDWSQIKEIAAEENMREIDVLEEFAGDISGVLFKEGTINDLIQEGHLLVKTGAELIWEMHWGRGDIWIPHEDGRSMAIEKEWTYLVFSDEEVRSQVAKHLLIKTKDVEAQIQPYNLEIGGNMVPLIGTTLKSRDLAPIGLGFDQEGFNLARSQGLNIIPQIRFWQGVTKEDLPRVFGEFKEQPVSAVFFNDADVPGIGLPPHKQKEALNDIALEIKKLGVPLGMIEFFPQKGLATLAHNLERNLVRMHSIAEKELPTMAQSRALDRYTLAVAERNMRVILVRFLPSMTFADYGGYLNQLHTSLIKEGFLLGTPQPFTSLPFSRLYLLIMGLGVAAGGALLLDSLNFRKTGIVIAGLGFLAFVGLLGIGEISLARKLMALLSVIIFPILSVNIFLTKEPLKLGSSIWQLIKMSLVSLIGALLMIGLLGDKTFMYSLDQFSGVKLAHLIPIVGIVMIFWFFKDYSSKSWRKLKNLLDYPVTVKYVILLGVLAVVLLIYILRTGNDGVATVSAWELAMRFRLDDLLVVRPRTKEFLIGHPLMLLLLSLGYRDKYLPLLAVAIIGQVSIVNTFAHIHTPLIISLMRTVNGLWMGILLGIILVLVLGVGQKLLAKWQLLLDKEA